MGRSFRSSESQALNAVMKMDLRSVGTDRNYQQALRGVADYLKSDCNNQALKNLTPEQANSYLEQRSEQVGQKTLDLDRQAMQAFLKATDRLGDNDKLTIVKSELDTIEKSRAYTNEQVQAVADRMTDKHSLAVEIARDAGLRAHELATLARPDEQQRSDRPIHDEKWSGKDGVTYTVAGKGGLVRDVVISHHLAERLEERRHETPVEVRDRNCIYQVRYELGHGSQFSKAFSAASNRAVGWSAGAHGLRHSYAQERMNTLQNNGMERSQALEIVSQEMGHFRAEITEVYLR